MTSPDHAWQISIERAREIQSDLEKKIKIEPLPRSIFRIAGFDISYIKKENILIAGMAIVEYPTLQLIESYQLEDSITFPYIPGYLSFREAPAILKLIDLYAKNIDIFMFDGHGVAHPRGLGIASHIGVLLNVASIGCAKKRLVGTYQMPAIEKGATSNLMFRDKLVAKVTRTRHNVKPVFVSVGNRAELNQSADLVLHCCTRYRLPEPTRLAHQLVTKAKN